MSKTKTGTAARLKKLHQSNFLNQVKPSLFALKLIPSLDFTKIIYLV